MDRIVDFQRRHADASAPQRLDNASGTGEAVEALPHSRGAGVHVGGGRRSRPGPLRRANVDLDGTNFEPGLDFYSGYSQTSAQAGALQTFAGTHNMKMVVVSIGGNDFDFADIVATCVADFLLLAVVVEGLLQQRRQQRRQQLHLGSMSAVKTRSGRRC